MRFIEQKVKASLTVEAAMVMPIILLTIAGIIVGGFRLHHIVFGKISDNVVREIESHLPDREAAEQEDGWENHPELVMRRMTLADAFMGD